MRLKLNLVPGIVVALVLLATAATTPAQEHNPARREPAARPQDPEPRVIVRFRTASTSRMQIQAAGSAVQSLSQSTGVAFRQAQDLGSRLHVMTLNTAAAGESMEEVLARLRSDPDVEFAEPDERRYLHAVPNDPLYTSQWFLQNVEASAIHANLAWDHPSQGGSANVVVAFLDTGVRFDHPDLMRVAQGGRLLDGYDFISEVPAANDGDGWDPDASDPGDWLHASDRTQPGLAGCELNSQSSWHGTRVAGVIGAQTNNASGISGITWSPRLLPVRVMGKCGGRDSDILTGLRWAAGISIPGVPDNPNPASIINMSLGSTGSCPASYQSVINELRARGVLVVISAGNETGHAVSTPANCAGVVAVAAVRHAGTKVGFSNIGPEIAISAPGGNCVNIDPGAPCLFSIHTTTDSGTTVPLGPTFTDQFRINVGTSFSAPIVAATAALVRSVNSQLNPSQVTAVLQKSASPFPTVGGVPACQVPTTLTGDQLECNCTTSTCGAGLVNANAAVALAMRPFVIATANPTNAAVGQVVNLDGTGSFASDGRTISTYSWTIVSGGGATPPTITNADTATASFVANAGGTVTVRLTVTDSAGGQNSEDVVITTPNPPTAPSTEPPPTSGGGGGGGGALEWLTIFAVLLSLLWRAGVQSSRIRSARSSHSLCARR